jgi:hypothetical protein
VVGGYQIPVRSTVRTANHTHTVEGRGGEGRGGEGITQKMAALAFIHVHTHQLHAGPSPFNFDLLALLASTVRGSYHASYYGVRLKLRFV